MSWHPAMPEEYRDAVVTGDARELAARIPDGSVDLVFTDPVYERIEDYRWLAEEAARVLKPDSSCVCWLTNGRIETALKGMCPPLSFVKVLSYHVIRLIAGIPRYARDDRSFIHWTPALWLEKGKCRPGGRMSDGTWEQWGGVSAGHKWHKGSKPLMRWTENLCPPEGVVWDPFTGGGSVPIAARALGRRFVAFEIDDATAEQARRHLADVPPPLALEWAEDAQQRLEIVA